MGGRGRGAAQRGHDVRVLTTRPASPPAHRSAGQASRRELDWYWRDHAFPARSRRPVLRTERANAAAWDRRGRRWRPDRCCGGDGRHVAVAAGPGARPGLPAVAVVADDWLSYGPRVDGLTRRLPGRAAPTPAAAADPGARARRGPASGARAGAAGQLHLRLPARGRAGRRRLDRAGLHRPPRRRPGALRRGPAAGPWRGRLLCCGRIDPRKGIATAIAALAQLPGAR